MQVSVGWPPQYEIYSYTYAQDVLHTLTIVEPFWRILQKKNYDNIEDCDELHHINVCTNSEQ